MSDVHQGDVPSKWKSSFRHVEENENCYEVVLVKGFQFIYVQFFWYQEQFVNRPTPQKSNNLNKQTLTEYTQLLYL